MVSGRLWCSHSTYRVSKRAIQHKTKYKMNAFWTRSLFFDPNDRSECAIQQNNERVRSNLGNKYMVHCVQHYSQTVTVYD